jgi:hypothetical protein
MPPKALSNRQKNDGKSEKADSSTAVNKPHRYICRPELEAQEAQEAQEEKERLEAEAAYGAQASEKAESRNPAEQSSAAKKPHRYCWKREEEREGCFTKGAAESDYIHEVKYLEHSRSAVSRGCDDIVEHSS